MDLNKKTDSVVIVYNSSQNKSSSARIPGNVADGYANLDSQGNLLFYLAPSINGQIGGAAYLRNVGSGFNYANYFPADWNHDGYTDFVCRDASGNLYFYPLQTNGVYPTSPSAVGNGFNFANYLVGDFTGDGNPDLIGITSTGTLYLYPFKFNTFIGNGGGSIVGTNFIYTHYLVADWTGDGKCDLICRDGSSALTLLISNGSGFGTGTNVGNGFNFDDYFIGEWTGDNLPDLVGRKNTGILYLYPFRNNTFIGNGGGRQIGSGFTSFWTKYFVSDLSGDGLSDITALDQSGYYYASQYSGPTNGTFPSLRLYSGPWNFVNYFQVWY